MERDDSVSNVGETIRDIESELWDIVAALRTLDRRFGLHWNVDDVNQTIRIVDSMDGGRPLYEISHEGWREL